jgi:hypothetical protein
MRGQILLPMGALALLTFIVLIFIPIRRFRAAFAGKVGPEDFELGESIRVPGNVSLPNRNYMNLTELPVLFYVVCLMFYATDRVDHAIVMIAWAYVATRTLHSLIHISYNNVFHRLIAFSISNIVLGTMWVLFFVKAA